MAKAMLAEIDELRIHLLKGRNGKPLSLQCETVLTDIKHLISSTANKITLSKNGPPKPLQAFHFYRKDKWDEITAQHGKISIAEKNKILSLWYKKETNTSVSWSELYQLNR